MVGAVQAVSMVAMCVLVVLRMVHRSAPGSSQGYVRNSRLSGGAMLSFAVFALASAVGASSSNTDWGLLLACAVLACVASLAVMLR